MIEVWAEILRETNGKMLTRKKKEAIATRKINAYNKEELGGKTEFTVKEVRIKIDWMLKKGKNYYSLYQKNVTGKGVEPDDEIELDLEAAQAAWPNFKVFYETFKDHPSLGPGSVEDSIIPSPITTSSEKTDDTLESDVDQEFESSSSPGIMEEDGEIAEEQAILNGDPPPRKKGQVNHVCPRREAIPSFLSMIEHESKLQTESIWNFSKEWNKTDSVLSLN